MTCVSKNCPFGSRAGANGQELLTRRVRSRGVASLHERLTGCLLGGAVGDALGAPFEGLWPRSIPPADALLADFGTYEGYPRGQWTDDTQLTLATVEGVLEAGDLDPAVIARRIARLWQRSEVIGPGGACTRAAWSLLRGVPWDQAGAPVGQAGNGAAMRVAFLGLLFEGEHASRLPVDVAAVARITHQDPRAVAGAVAVAAATRSLLDDRVDPARVCAQVSDAARGIDAELAALVLELPTYLHAPVAEAAPRLAWAGQPDVAQALEGPTITPFVVPTVLACLWAALRSPDDWGRAVSTVIGLGGDVDTTGAITGALLGARLGERAIPAHLVARVVGAARIRELAAELARAAGC